MPLRPQDSHRPPRTLCLGVAATSHRRRAAGVWVQGLPPMKKSLEERFWEKVDKSGGPDACWPWTARRTKKGYGQIWVSSGKRAHRVAWEIANGSPPTGLCVLHRCDNPPCVNPAHLFLGTIADNNADRDRKGRHVSPRGDASGSRMHPESRARGERHGSAKLTVAQVLGVRRLAAAGVSRSLIARCAGVDKSTVDRIVARKRWRHV